MASFSLHRESEPVGFCLCFGVTVVFGRRLRLDGKVLLNHSAVAAALHVAADLVVFLVVVGVLQAQAKMDALTVDVYAPGPGQRRRGIARTRSVIQEPRAVAGRAVERRELDGLVIVFEV
jgi:hypothetical protein